MTITWQGDNYFKLKTGNITVVFNPYGLEKKASFGKAKGEIILFTDSSQISKIKLDGDSFIIDGPGEYEKEGVFVYGRQINGNVVYLLVSEDIKIAFLGEYGHSELSDHDLELLEGADILIVPVGGGDLSTPKEAGTIIRQVEPRIIIPSCFKGGQINDFIKEIGLKPDQLDKLSIKKKDLPQDEMKLVVLKD